MKMTQPNCTIITLTKNQEPKLMRTTLFISILFCLAIFSCKKDADTNSSNPSFIDTVSPNRYYSSDIIPQLFSGLYGKWKLTHVTGGYADGEHELVFDYIVFKPNGIYGIFDNDSLKEFGRINLLEQNKDWIRIDMVPDELSKSYVFDLEKFVNLSHNDTLKLYAPCCDRYDFKLIRQK